LKPIADISNRLAFLGHLLGGFDLEFFGVTLTTLGSFYLGLIVRLTRVSTATRKRMSLWVDSVLQQG
jgi:hypothetical protein